ncbi:lipopolysaccharide biosynthesis protein [Bacillus cereus]|uniref:lipopolysaccharide biosynthesis protein n=2 Tax=Bacillaceae TaxID=186817 RepID=UPI0005ABAE8E|nr:hypothetical protein [Bacillus cereus]
MINKMFTSWRELLEKKSSSIYAILDQAVVSASNFALAFLLARFLPPNEYGAYVLALSVLLFINGIQTALSTIPLNVRGSSLKERKLHEYIQSLIYFHVLYGILFSFILIIVYFILYKNSGSTEITQAFLGVCIAFFFIQFQEFFKRLLYFWFRIKEVFIIDFVINVCLVTSIIIMNLMGRLDSLSIYIMMSVTNLLGIVLCIYKIEIRKKWKTLNLKSIISGVLWNLNYGKWILGGNIFYWIGSQSYLFAATIFLDISSTAKIAATQNIINAVNVLVMGIQNIAMPMANKKLDIYGIAVLKKYIKKLIVIISVSVGLYGIVITLFSESIMDFLYKGQYSDVLYLMGLWSISFLISAINRMYTIFLNSTGKNKVNFYIYAFNAVLSVSLIVPITKVFEIYGMAIWTIIAGIIMLMINIKIFKSSK